MCDQPVPTLSHFFFPSYYFSEIYPVFFLYFRKNILYLRRETISIHNRISICPFALLPERSKERFVSYSFAGDPIGYERNGTGKQGATYCHPER